MKKWLKRILYVLAAIVLLIAGAVAVWWPELRILLGTGELEGEPTPVPEAIVPQRPVPSKGVADWPCWQTAARDTHGGTIVIRKDWSAGLKKLWEVDFLCQGRASTSWSAPVVQGDRLVVCGRDNSKDLVFCLDPGNGKLLWQGSYAARTENAHGAGARATPAIDGDRVYTFGRSGDLVCWALLDGREIWRRNVGDEGGKEPTWGHSSSPLVFQDLVIVQGGGSARAVAYEKATGTVAWKSGQGPAGYAALTVMPFGDKRIVLAFHGKGLAGLDPGTGAELWNVPWETAYDVNATTPVEVGDQVFISSGYGTGCALVKVAEASADILWRSEVMASHHSDARIIDGFIYGYSGQSNQNKGPFKCVELSTGKEQWAAAELGWGTCTLVDGHLLCCDIAGNIFLVKPDSAGLVKVTEFPRALGEIKGPLWTLPVVANGQLYLRFKQRLACYDLTAAGNP